MNKPIRALSVFCLILFALLLANATFLQYWQSGDLTSLSEHPDNRRVRDEQFSQERGAILVDGKAIAQSVPTKDGYDYQRVYPQARRYAALTGYYTRDYGLGGIEATQNDILSGSDPGLFVNRVIDLIGNDDTKGGNVTLTVNPAAQKAAADGLRALGANTKGAVVAIQPSTGKILAMATNPTYDPNALATHDFTQAGKVKSRLEADDDGPLQNRAIEDVLPPGSTFKMVTSAAALGDRFTPTSKVPGGRSLDLPQTNLDLKNENGVSCGGDQITLTRALDVSCNVAFGWLGTKLGASKLRDQADKFGFGQRYFTQLDDALTRQAISRFPEQKDLAPPFEAYSAIGQYEVAATPLQMAMVAAGIANNGKVMKPYLVDELQTPDLDTLRKTDPESLTDDALSPADAKALTEMMVSVVDNGTGTAAKIDGVEVAGKTGTAQSASNRSPYAWFTSFAPATNSQVAVAVLVQDAGVQRDEISGNGLAAPIAKSVMQAVLKK
ncbi:penicillin-binding protein [Marmoricola endophyticus]|uniref:Penicillin-binding protein n=1 Tax=Marmoricola endophyticus TaxID=2040280 RepID=A0A917F529_9ACTN|nr:penicillin-binding protein 2 [Marmoricola endophyticus]GGF47445.1 penicillin-binding protein [Marmoricola endophyticus]